MSSQPLVAAVMVTGKDPSRIPLAEAAIQSFQDQTYENKILIVVNDGDGLFDNWEVETIGQLSPLPAKVDAIDTLSHRVIHVRVQPGQSLGKLRNIGLKVSELQRADFVIQWDDDDFYHKHRIEYQIAGSAVGYCTLLKNQIRYDMVNNNAFNFRWKYDNCPGIPGTILHPLKPTQYYADQRKGEDETFIDQHFHNRCIVLDNLVNPQLYVRLVHGSNTWDTHHIMQKMPGFGLCRNTWHLTREQAHYLNGVLDWHYNLGERVLDATIHEPAAS